MSARRLALAVVVLPELGCALSGLSPIPDVRSPADRAHELDPKCRASTDERDAATLSRDAINAVEPYRVKVPSSSGHDVRMLGARLHVNPLPGLTRESLALALQCHQARLVLGASPSAPDDPYVLPDDWLTIEVDSEGNGFTVDVSPVDFKNGREVLARARRYVHPDPPPSSPR